MSSPYLMCRRCWWGMVWRLETGDEQARCSNRNAVAVQPPPNLVDCSAFTAKSVGNGGRSDDLRELQQIALKVDPRPMPGQHL